MNWATANGYLATANSNSYSTEKNIAVPKGCAMYRGKDGQDAPEHGGYLHCVKEA
ncbi:hypothetical protein [Bacteroides stercorirosoris]|uniref:hypothetical protein n=1 Tax=Bacteroides stercorirosoris TaxID=871324 RepID=UPI000AE37F48|nr:hypothetical protein [Bacteroides stercorirosoris]